MPKIVDKEAVRAGIMKAALATYADGGVHAASLERVAMAAGIGKGTLYHYFKSKEDLAVAIADQYFARLEDQLSALDSLDSLDALLDALAGFVERSDRDYQDMRVLIDIFSPGFGTGKPLARARHFMETASAKLEKTLTELRDKGALPGSIDPADLARTLVALLDGIGLHIALLGLPADARSRMTAALMATLRHGLG